MEGYLRLIVARTLFVVVFFYLFPSFATRGNYIPVHTG